MPGLPELPIRTDPDARQTKPGDWDDSEKWQLHRGPKKKQEPRGTVPQAWMELGRE